MKLSEKIYALRTARGLSQGDLAERLEVSRQSVSKWETGQSVPDLDKIIKLADLFGISVDELVRDEVRPEPPKTEPRVVYVERNPKTHAAGYFIGIVMTFIGGGIFLIGLLQRDVELLVLGLVLLAGGISMVIKKRFHWSAFLWMMTAATVFLNFFLAAIMAIVSVGLMYYADEEEDGK